MDEQTIAAIEKTRTQDIRVRLLEFHGRSYVDIRLFVIANATERVPTKKGVAIPPPLLPALIAALEAAERKARADGLIRDETKAA